MINTISSSGSILCTNSMPYVSFTQQDAFVGVVKYNSSANRYEVFNGQYWIPAPSVDTQISLSTNANLAINWAMDKMEEENKISKLAESSPAINDLVNQMNTLKQQLNVVVALTK